MIPDKLTADISEKYKVSIRLMPDGISFWGYIPSEKDSFFMESIPFDNNLTMLEALKNAIFEFPCFSFIYQSLHVVCVGEKYTMVPDHVFVEEDKDVLFDFCFPKNHSQKVIIQPVSALNAFILFNMDEDIYAFLVRSLLNPQFIHSLSPLLITWQRKSLHVFSKLMHVAIHSRSIDVFCMDQGNLLFVNSYHYTNVNDVIYYIMYICKQTGFDQLEDSLTISGKQDLCREVLSVVKKYVKKSNSLQQKLTDYQNTSSHEPTIDMITLMECGL